MSTHQGKIALILLSIVVGSLATVMAGQVPEDTFTSTGLVSYVPVANVLVNPSNTIGLNNLSLGTMIDWQWSSWSTSATRRQLTQDAGFKLIRTFDFRKTSPMLMPCTYWDEATMTGTWDWTNVDNYVSKIFEIGAEPLFCLGYARASIENYIPTGMSVDPTTLLPHPQSYAKYCAEWVKHFKSLGWPVRFYEIFNEPFSYFGWSADYTKLGYFKDVWNECARQMRAVNPNVLLSFDYTTARRVLDYWVQYGENLDFLDAHKYDCNSVPGFDDQEVFKRAEERRFLSAPDTTFYGFNDAKQVWFNGRGKMLLAVISESNVNSGYEGGTDPRMAQMVGAVRAALVLRTGILTGLNYHVQYEFSSSTAVAQSKGGGYGFGMINSDNNKPWYSYYAQKLVGENLAVGDRILESSCNSNNIRVVAWLHESTLSILLICQVDTTVPVVLTGLSGQRDVEWVDSTIPFTDGMIQRGTMDLSNPWSLKGYTVMMLQLRV